MNRKATPKSMLRKVTPKFIIFYLEQRYPSMLPTVKQHSIEDTHKSGLDKFHRTICVTECGDQGFRICSDSWHR